VVICDTDALATALWHERYLGRDAPVIRALADARRYAFHILTSDEVPWEDDGTRDLFDDRPHFHRRFREELEASRPFMTVDGPPAQRLATAIEAIDRLLAEAGDPQAGEGTKRRKDEKTEGSKTTPSSFRPFVVSPPHPDPAVHPRR
jgi:nicotinamide riboside kinase